MFFTAFTSLFFIISFNSSVVSSSKILVNEWIDCFSLREVNWLFPASYTPL